MGISYTEIESAGDALPNNRHVLYFPSLPGLFNGYDLTLRHTTVTLPPLQVGQIIVKQLGWSVAYAGFRTQQNTFSCEFVETSKSPVMLNLAKWQDSAAGMKSPLAKMKQDMAVTAMLVAYDSAGKKALVVNLLNVWPMTITYGNYSEESAPAMVQVEFSVDAVDILGVVFTDGDFELPSTSSGNNDSQPYPALWYTSLTSSDLSQASVSNHGPNASAQIATDLGLNNKNIASTYGL